MVRVLICIHQRPPQPALPEGCERLYPCMFCVIDVHTCSVTAHSAAIILELQLHQLHLYRQPSGFRFAAPSCTRSPLSASLRLLLSSMRNGYLGGPACDLCNLCRLLAQGAYRLRWTACLLLLLLVDSISNRCMLPLLVRRHVQLCVGCDCSAHAVPSVEGTNGIIHCCCEVTLHVQAEHQVMHIQPCLPMDLHRPGNLLSVLACCTQCCCIILSSAASVQGSLGRIPYPARSGTRWMRAPAMRD